MTTRTTDAVALVARIKAAGWPVTADKEAWHTTAPDGYRIAIHRTSSDRRAQLNIMRILKAHGFLEAEAKAEQRREAARARRIKADAAKAEKATKLAERNEKAVRRAQGIEPLDVHWATTARATPEARVCWVTPADARKILEHSNVDNRKLRPERVGRWLKAMNAGRWRFISNGIGFNVEGVVQNGQHRLAALEVSELAGAAFVVVVGLPSDGFVVTDTGFNRTAQDMFGRVGVPKAGVVTAAVKMTIRYREKVPLSVCGTNNAIDLDEVEAELAADRAGFLDLLPLTTQLRDVDLPPSVAIAGPYLLLRHHPRELVDEFLDGLLYGSPEGDPRRALLRHVRDITIGRGMESHRKLALFIVAFNFWFKRQKRTRLQVLTSDPIPRVVEGPRPASPTVDTEDEP